MATPAADDIADRLLTSWEDVDRWLLSEARELVRERLVPETAAYVLHGGVTTLLIRPPTPCTADAAQIGAALAHMIHPMQPDQVLVAYPGATPVSGDRSTATLQAMAGERGGGWRHIEVPVPYDDPRSAIVPATVTTPAAWAAPVLAAFDDVAPPRPDISRVRHLDREFIVAVNPDGPAAALASRWPM